MLFLGMVIQIRNCQNCSSGMSVAGWCVCHGITKANYYYRLRRVREACPETIQEEMPVQQMVPAQYEFLRPQEPKDCGVQPGLDKFLPKGF